MTVKPGEKQTERTQHATFIAPTVRFQTFDTLTGECGEAAAMIEARVGFCHGVIGDNIIVCGGRRHWEGGWAALASAEVCLVIEARVDCASVLNEQ